LKVGRNNYTSLTDPVTPAKATAQFELLQTLLDYGYIDDENFKDYLGNPMSMWIEKIIDVVSESKLFSGQWMGQDLVNDEGQEYSNRAGALSYFLTKDTEYTMRSAEFSLSATKNSYVQESEQINTTHWDEIKYGFKEGYENPREASVAGAIAGAILTRNPVGAAAGAGIVSSAKSLFNRDKSKKLKKERDKENETPRVVSSKTITISIPDGYRYDDYSIYGTIVCNKEATKVFPAVNIYQDNDKLVQLNVNLYIIDKLIDDEYYMFNGKLEVLFKRKL